MQSVSRTKQHINPVTNVRVVQSGNRYHWQREFKSGAARTSTESWVDPVDAIDTAISVASVNGVRCEVSEDLYHMYTAAHQVAGIQMYRAGVDSECCANRWQSEGWKAACADDAQPLALWGWPTTQAVAA